MEEQAATTSGTSVSEEVAIIMYTNDLDIDTEEQAAGSPGTPVSEGVADIPLSDGTITYTGDLEIDAKEQAVNVSAPLVSQAVSDALPPDIILQQDSPLLRISGEVRNMIYRNVLQPDLRGRELYHIMHNLGSTCRLFRYEFWTFCMVNTAYKLNLRDYHSFLNAFYPQADEAIMKKYRGRFQAHLRFNGAIYTNTIKDPASGETADLRQLIIMLRASPSVHFCLGRGTRWMCERPDLEKFINFARSSKMWAAAHHLGAVNLRVNHAELAKQWDAPTFWVIDVHLKRDFQHSYEQLGLLAYLEERKSMGCDGITFLMVWDRPEIVAESKVGRLGNFKSYISGRLVKLVPRAFTYRNWK